MLSHDTVQVGDTQDSLTQPLRILQLVIRLKTRHLSLQPQWQRAPHHVPLLLLLVASFSPHFGLIVTSRTARLPWNLQPPASPLCTEQGRWKTLITTRSMELSILQVIKQSDRQLKTHMECCHGYSRKLD